MTKKTETGKKELEELLKRVQADFDNYRKRAEQEKQQFRQFANANLLLDLLPVLDNFRRAAQHVPENLKEDNWAKGMQAIERQLEDIVKQNGLEEITVTRGDAFDPALHESVASEEATDIPEGHISTVLESGFTLGGKLLRPAKVKVSKHQV